VVFNAGHSELEIVAEHRSQVVAIVSHEHDLAAHGAVAAVDLLDGMCLALPPRNYATRLAFDALLPPEKAGIVPHLTVNSIAALKLYARSGAGVAVVPSFAVSGENVDAALVTLELEGAERNGTRVCLCRHSNRQLSAAAIYVLEDIAAAFPRLAELL
jgi:DNA-binding transcriptional LysR family regulator